MPYVPVSADEHTYQNGPLGQAGGRVAIASAKGKRSSQGSHRSRSKALDLRRTIMSAAMISGCIAMATFSGQSFAGTISNSALPTGGQVAAGQAVISQSGNVMNINQSSQRAVVNWNSFDVGSNATVNFNQPNSNAATLNRVNGASKSMIDGAVNANGQVTFINPNGIVFGRGAEINTGALTATTMNIKDSDFMNGKNIYLGGDNGKVINRGTITGNNINSYIALMAPEVKNEGVLIATLSGNNTIALVSGKQVTLNFTGNQLINVTVNTSVIHSLIENKRVITTEGGQILIAANSASDLMSSVVNNAGVISANSITTQGGKVYLSAGTVNQNRAVTANSDSAEAGQITITGSQVNLGSASITTANGGSGGGEIWIGKTTSTPTQSLLNADSVIVAKGALLEASATQSGHGGTIGIWSEVITKVAGTLRAEGGLVAGNGGLIETSGNTLNILESAMISTKSQKGLSGNWLLDPYDFYIAASGGNITGTALTSALASNSVTISAPNTCNNAPCSSTSSGTAGNIYVNDAVSWSANTLTLNSGNNIYIGTSSTTGSLSATGSGSLVLNPSYSSISGYTSGGKVLTGMASTPTGGAHSNGFNGQINFSGSGTVTIGGSVYTVINSEANFVAISSSGNYVIGSDLTFTTSYTSGPVSSFNGNLNGFGHKITGLNIQSSTFGDAGLFAFLSGGSISNLGVSGTVIGSGGGAGSFSGQGYSNFTNAYSSANVSGGGYGIGGFIGYGFGTISIINSYTSGNISGINAEDIGGFVGFDYGYLTMNGSFTSGNISGNSNVGGLIGTLQPYTSNISNSYSTATITGTGTDQKSIAGLIAYLPDSDSASKIRTLSGNYFAGTINATVSHPYYSVGAIAGTSGTYVVFTNNYWNVTTNPTLNTIYGGVGVTNSAISGVVSLNSTQMKTASNFVGFGIALGSFTVASGWGFQGSTNSGFPVNCSIVACSSYDSSLLSLTFIGSSGASWAVASNWEKTGTSTISSIAPVHANDSAITSITINSGSIVDYASASVGSISIPITNNGVISFSGVSNVTLSGVISGTGSLLQTGSGVVTLSGANTYSGSTIVNSGTVAAGIAYTSGSGAFGNGSNIGINGGTLALGSYNETVGTVTVGSGGGSITGTSGSLTAMSYTFNNTSGHGVSASSILSGSGALTQAGSGATTLSGANTYSGGTVISAGMLLAGSPTAFGTGAVSVASGAALDLSGQIITSSGTLTLNGSGISSNGALTNSSASAGSYAGPIAIPNFSLINASSGSINIGGGITGAGSVTFNGPITLSSNINTTGAQIYNGLLTLGNTLTLTSSNSITINSSVGYVGLSYAQFLSKVNSDPAYNLSIEADTININADITTLGTQTYGSAAHTAKIIIGDNVTNGITRTLISEDPSIKFYGTVDDSVIKTHYLVVKAVSVSGGTTPSVSFSGDVGSTVPLKTLTVATGVQATSGTPQVSDILAVPALYSGTITLEGNVNTDGDQTYTTKNVEFGDGSSGKTQTIKTNSGNITFNLGSTVGAGAGLVSGTSNLKLVFTPTSGKLNGLSGQGVSFSDSTVTRSGSSSSDVGIITRGLQTTATTMATTTTPPASGVEVKVTISDSGSAGNATVSSGATGLSGTSLIISAAPIASSTGATVPASTALATTSAAPAAPSVGSAAPVSTITVTTVTAPSVGTSGLINISVPKEMASSSSGFSVALPIPVASSSAASSSVGGAVQSAPASSVRVTLSDGSALPSWIKFDVTTATLSASAVPAGAFPLQIVVTVNGVSTTVVISEKDAS